MKSQGWFAVALAALAGGACGGARSANRDAAPGDRATAPIGSSRSDAAVDVPASDAPADAADSGADAAARGLDAVADLDGGPDRASAADGPRDGGDAGMLALSHGAALCADDGWCWQNPLPHGDSLYGVWGSSPSDVWTAGQDGLVAHYDGHGWARVVVPVADPPSPATSGRLRAIWGSGPGDVWIVSEDGAVIRGDGRHWDRLSTGVGAAVLLTAIWGSGPDDVWVVGGDDHAASAHWTGARWDVATLPTGGVFEAVWGAGRDLVFASTAGGIYRWDATMAQWVSSAVVGAKSIWGASAADAWAVGRGQVLRWNGATWKPNNGVTSTDYDIVIGRAADDVWLVGGSLSHWDGNAFSKTALALRGQQAAAIGGELWVVGAEPFVYRHDGVAWTNLVTRQVPYGYTAIGGTSAKDVWAAGIVSLVHFDGAAWTTATTPATTQGYLGVQALAPDDAWACGEHGTGHWDGKSWSAVDVPVPSAYQEAVWGSASDDVWVVGLGGNAARWNGKDWTALATPGSSLYAVSGTGPNDVWAVGDWYVLHYDGADLKVAWDGALDDDHFNAVYAASKTEVWVSGRRDLRLGAGGFVPSATTAGVVSFGGRDNRPWAVAANRGVVRWTGTDWATSLPTTVLLEGVWAAPSGEVFVAGVGGALLERK